MNNNPHTKKFLVKKFNFLRSFARKWLPFRIKIQISRFLPNLSISGLAARYNYKSYLANGVSSRNWGQITISEKVVVENGVRFHTNDESKSKRIIVQPFAYIGPNCFFSAGELIEIGKYCNIGANTNLLAAGHDYSNPLVPCAESKIVSYGRMILGPNTWIGVGSTILGGIEIGFGSIVGAGSLVNKNIPPLSFVVGRPASIIKVYSFESSSWIDVPGSGEERELVLYSHLKSIPTEDEYLQMINRISLNAK